MTEEDQGKNKFDRIISSIGFMVIGAVIGAMIGLFGGLFSSERSLKDILFPWAYILGGVFALIGYVFPRATAVFF